MERGIAYREIMKRFPTVQSMAKSSVDEVLHLWQGWILLSSTPTLAALDVMELHGILPNDYEVYFLPGIGPYRSSVASIAFKLAYLLVWMETFASVSPSNQPRRTIDETGPDVCRHPSCFRITRRLESSNDGTGSTCLQTKKPFREDCPSQILAKAVCERRTSTAKEVKEKIVEYTCIVRIDSEGFLNSTSDLIPGCSLDYGVQKWLRFGDIQIANFLVQFDITYLTEKWLYLCGNRMEQRN